MIRRLKSSETKPMSEDDEVVNDNPTQLEWLLMHSITNFFQEVMDDSERIEDLIAGIERGLRFEDGYWGSEYVGILPVEQIRAEVEAFFARGFVTRISNDVAVQMVQERVEGQGQQDLSIDELVGKYVCSDYGFQRFYGVVQECGEPTIHWARQRSLYLEQTEDRWTFRSPQPFTCIDACTALRDKPTSTICVELGCKLENIGPWASAAWGGMFPSGFRLVCYRRTH